MDKEETSALDWSLTSPASLENNNTSYRARDKDMQKIPPEITESLKKSQKDQEKEHAIRQYVNPKNASPSSHACAPLQTCEEGNKAVKPVNKHKAVSPSFNIANNRGKSLHSPDVAADAADTGANSDTLDDNCCQIPIPFQSTSASLEKVDADNEINRSQFASAGSIQDPPRNFPGSSLLLKRSIAVSSDDYSSPGENAARSTPTMDSPFFVRDKHGCADRNAVSNSNDDESDDFTVGKTAAKPLSFKDSVIFQHNELEHGCSEGVTSDGGSDNDANSEGVPSEERDVTGAEKTADNPSSPTYALIAEIDGKSIDQNSDVIDSNMNEVKPAQEMSTLFDDSIATCSLQAIKVLSSFHLENRLQNVDYLMEWASELSMLPRGHEPVCQLQFILK